MHLYTIKKKQRKKITYGIQNNICRLRENMKRELKDSGWKWKNFMVNSPLGEYKMKYNYKGH